MLLMSCDKGGTHSEGTGFLYDDGVEHGMIVLGDRLDNPYTTENAQKAFSAVYPTKSRDIVQTTDLYVRFLPENQEEFDLLEEMGVQMLDHPLDFEIITEGDYYHDPSVGEDNITWQYAVVDKDFDFPDIRYEIIDECFLADNSEQTKSMTDIDWAAVEAESYSHMIKTVAAAESSRFTTQLSTYRVMPAMFKLKTYLDFLEKECQGIRKFIVASGLNDEIYELNFEQKERLDLIDTDITTIK